MYFLCFLYMSGLFHFWAFGEKSGEARLTEDISSRLAWDNMKDAIPQVLPVYDLNDVLNVSVAFQLLKILDLNEKDQLLTTMYQKKYVWYNYQMTWRPEFYDGVKRMRYPKREIWIPDIVLLFSTYSYVPAEKGAEYVTVEYDGTITMFEPTIYSVACEIDMYDFPYDTQHCEMRWGSWSYLETELNMQSPSDTMDLSAYLEDQEWILFESKVFEEVAEYKEGLTINRYEDMVYQFSLRRIPTFYFNLILIPTFLLSALMFTVFWISPTRPDRTAVAMGVFGGFMLFLLLVVNIAPPSTGIKLGTYYSISIIMVVISIVLSGATVAIASKEVTMNFYLRKATLCTLKAELGRGTTWAYEMMVMVEKIGCSIGIFRQYDHMMRFSLTDTFSTGTSYLLNADHLMTNTGERRELNMDKLDVANRRRLENRRDWQVMAVVIDRCTFAIFALTTMICMGLFFPWPKMGTRAF